MKNDALARITIDLPSNLQKKLKALAALHGKSMREIVISTLESELSTIEGELQKVGINNDKEKN